MASCITEQERTESEELGTDAGEGKGAFWGASLFSWRQDHLQQVEEEEDAALPFLRTSMRGPWLTHGIRGTHCG